MNRAIVGLGSCGLAAGGRKVRDALAAGLAARGIEASLGETGCYGLCYREPLVELQSEVLGRHLFGDVQPEGVPALLDAFFVHGQLPETGHIAAAGQQAQGAEAAFLQAQQRIVLGRCGHIDPRSLDDYLAHGGYLGLRRALSELGPLAVIGEIERSGLRGRGGAGFSTARKWRLAQQAQAADKVVICNADEGDPGAFMDRNLVEGDPFAVIEGLTIAAFAVGASTGYVYVRQEYPLAVTRLEAAVVQARAQGWLGADILGSGFGFELEIRRGAGAFVCGEETALIASLEGRRGVPRRRPPYPVASGLHGRPTCINNVETCAAAAWILANGPEGFARHGTGASRGTKIFSLVGDVKRSGMVEVPMGITIRRILEDIGGGPAGVLPLKAVQIGGPSGGCLPERLFDTRIDYESLRETGAIMGSGSLIALDAGTCMVDVARYFLAFTQDESCGRCTFCRVGTRRMLDILERLCAGDGQRGDLDLLEQLGRRVVHNSLCGLGGSAPNPVLTTLRYFREEYEAHLQGRCPAGTCKALIDYRIDPAMCDGCTLCMDQCPALAITPLHRAISLLIDPEICTRCGGCKEVCRFQAVVVS